jgi:hypothetical protein
VSLELRCRRILGLGMAVTVLGVGAGCQKKETKPPDPIAAAFADFQKRVDGYMTLRKRLVDSVGELDPTRSQAEIATRAAALGQALIAARAQAKPGDIFTPEIATILATLIKEEYGRRADTVLETREDQQEELPNFVPRVNQIYPTTYPLATFPPALLPLLPPLPNDVEYRVVQHYLVLRDIEANLIIDFMPNAVP